MVPGTLSGQPAAKTALRPMLVDCSPVCITQPITTSSMMPGSIPVRSTSAFIVSAMRSTGCQSFNLPLRRPSGVRMASTMTALNMVSPKIVLRLQSAVWATTRTNFGSTLLKRNRVQRPPKIRNRVGWESDNSDAESRFGSKRVITRQFGCHVMINVEFH